MKDFAVARPARAEWAGNIFDTILSAAETGGAMTIIDNVCPPRFGPPMHIHQAEDEIIVVLSGDLEVSLAGARRRAGPGQAVFIPRGVEHTFRVVSHTHARLLVILTPSGFEGFFADMSDGQFRIPEDMPAVLESAERHSLTFTGPPLSDEAA